MLLNCLLLPVVALLANVTDTSLSNVAPPNEMEMGVLAMTLLAGLVDVAGAVTDLAVTRALPSMAPPGMSTFEPVAPETDTLLADVDEI